MRLDVLSLSAAGLGPARAWLRPEPLIFGVWEGHQPRPLHFRTFSAQDSNNTFDTSAKEFGAPLAGYDHKQKVYRSQRAGRQAALH